MIREHYVLVRALSCKQEKLIPVFRPTDSGDGPLAEV